VLVSFWCVTKNIQQLLENYVDKRRNESRSISSSLRPNIIFNAFLSLLIYVLSEVLKIPCRPSATVYSLHWLTVVYSINFIIGFLHPKYFTFWSIHVEVRRWCVRRGSDVTSGPNNMGLQALQQACPLYFSSRRQRLAYEDFSKKPPHVCRIGNMNWFFGNDSGHTTRHFSLWACKSWYNHSLRLYMSSQPLILIILHHVIN
jgi:hypothetical protein